MPTSIVPQLIDALITNGRTALPSIQVLDGVGASGSTDEPGDYVMVGVDDALGNGPVAAASSRQSFATVGAQAARDEEGTLTCVAMSWNGDANAKTARDAAYASCDAFATFIRAGGDQGVSGVLWVEYGTDHELTQISDENGAMALVMFQVHFRARV